MYICVYVCIYIYIYISEKDTLTQISLSHSFFVVVYCHLLINPSGPLKVEELDA